MVVTIILLGFWLVGAANYFHNEVQTPKKTTLHSQTKQHEPTALISFSIICLLIDRLYI